MRRIIVRPLVVAFLVIAGMVFAQGRGPDTGELPQGGTVRIPIQTDPATLNPMLPGELASQQVGWTLFSPLTAVNPWTNTLEPHLATSWEPNEDLTQWTFHLREGVKWHDGAPLTAEDVVFTFDRIRDPEEGATTLPDFKNVTEVVALDPSTVRVTLSAPDAFFADRLSLGGNEILPSHILSGFARLDDAREFKTEKPIGTGPFKMGRMQPGSFYEVVANEDYFQGRPNLDSIIFRVVPDGNTRVTQLLSGELNLIEAEAAQLPMLERNQKLVVDAFDSLGYRLFAWNFLNPLFEDVRVREAMMHGVDRRSILQTVAPGLGYVGDTYLPTAISWIPQADVEFREYDPELAKQLLAEAGWVPGADGILQRGEERFSFRILVDRGDVQHEQMGLILQQYFQDLGMDGVYDLAERGGRWLEESQGRTFQSRLAAFPMTNIDWAQRLYTSKGPFNSQSYSNAAVDALFAELSSTADRDEQGRILERIQEELYADPPNMVLFFRKRLNVYDVRLGNMPPFSIKDAMPYSHLLYLRK